MVFSDQIPYSLNMHSKIFIMPTRDISDWASFHQVSKQVFGFPEFYGRNMNAWIDCMTSVDAPEDGMTRVTVGVGELLVICVEEASDFQSRCPEQYDALVECSSFVNHRRIDIGLQPVIALMFSCHFNKSAGRKSLADHILNGTRWPDDVVDAINVRSTAPDIT